MLHTLLFHLNKLKIYYLLTLLFGPTRLFGLLKLAGQKCQTIGRMSFMYVPLDEFKWTSVFYSTDVLNHVRCPILFFMNFWFQYNKSISNKKVIAFVQLKYSQKETRKTSIFNFIIVCQNLKCL